MDQAVAEVLQDLVVRRRPEKPSVAQVLELVHLLHSEYETLTEKELRRVLKPSQLLCVADPKSKEDIAAEERALSQKRAAELRRAAIEKEPAERVSVTIEFDVDAATGGAAFVRATNKETRRCRVRTDASQFDARGVVAFEFSVMK